jgi:two-component system, chemotaxis family, protein-glutamate methylesterase/glutaminase
MDERLKVLIVDDTVVYRRILSEVLEGFPDVQVVGTAPHGRLALAKLESTPADLVLLDVEMPEMNGPETLREINQRFPGTSVVMISGANLSSADYTVRALELGALDFIRKPEGSDVEASRAELKDRMKPLLRLVRTRMNMKLGGPTRTVSAPERTASQLVAVPEIPIRVVRQAPNPARIDVIGIGVSTGGPNALTEVIPLLPGDLPVPILLVQHMPPLFTASLAEHLNNRSALSVREARDGEPILPGHVLIAPGGMHMVVRRRMEADGNTPIVGLNENPPENSCRPSVDVLFRSLATQYDGNMLAVVMTGMGSDGCEGVRTMKRRGCHCITQTEATCVVYGMPMAVDEAGLSDEQVNLNQIAHRITTLVRKGRAS